MNLQGHQHWSQCYFAVLAGQSVEHEVVRAQTEVDTQAEMGNQVGVQTQTGVDIQAEQTNPVEVDKQAELNQEAARSFSMGQVPLQRLQIWLVWHLLS